MAAQSSVERDDDRGGGRSIFSRLGRWWNGGEEEEEEGRGLDDERDPRRGDPGHERERQVAGEARQESEEWMGEKLGGECRGIGIGRGREG